MHCLVRPLRTGKVQRPDMEQVSEAGGVAGTGSLHLNKLVP